MDEPFAGLTAAEVATFSELIAGFRAEGRAVLLVDHNVKGVAALVDRVLAMYLGEHVAEGTADEVMRDETVRAVYLGGKIETARAPPQRGRDRRRRCSRCDDVSVLYGKAQALEKCRIHVARRRVRFRRRAERRRQDHAVQRDLRPGAVQRRRSPGAASSLRGRTAGRDRARRHRAMPGDARAVRRHDACGRTSISAAST